MTTLDPFAHYDGSYVLGALSDGECSAFEQHLLSCDACTERVRELSPLPALLAGLPASAYDDPQDPPAALLADLLRQVESERRRRRRFTAGLAGLAAACVIALAVVAWPSGPSATSGGSASRPQAMSAVINSPVRATAALTDVKWGTQIRLECHYDAYAPGVSYQLVVVDKRNVSHPAGSWTLTQGDAARFTSGTSLHRDQISKIEITSGDHPILQLAF